MTVVSDIGSHDATRASRRSAWMFVVAVVAVICAAIAMRAVIPFNVDVSWWLIVCERMLDGQRLYTDILETNPPMAASAYLVAVWLARAMSVRPEIMIDGLVFALTAASLLVTGRLIRPIWRIDREATGWLCVWAVVLLGILPMYDFAQREHLALLIGMPALATAGLRADRAPVSWSAIVVAALSAAITVSFKPYFVLAFICVSLAAALHARSWRIVFAPENWIAASLVAAYGALTYLAYPDYFTVIYPLVRDVYLLLSVPIWALLLTTAVALWFAAVLFVLVLRRQRQLDAPLTLLLAASFGYALAFVMQRKGWGYHAYPMVALGLLAAGYAIADLKPDPTKGRLHRLAALAVAFALLGKACLWFNASVDVRKIEAEVAALGPHPKILMLSAAATLGHPLVRSVDGVWVSRQEALWVREIVRRSLRDHLIDEALAERLQSYVARERAGLIADFKAGSPDVVLIDNDNSDWGAWAAADSEIAALLKPYVKASTVDGVDVLVRPEFLSR